MNVNIRNRRKVHSLLTALDELNYAPYMPPQAETRIHDIIQRGKRRRDGQHIEEVKLTLTKIEQCKPFAVIILYSYAIHACTQISECFNFITITITALHVLHVNYVYKVHVYCVVMLLTFYRCYYISPIM